MFSGMIEKMNGLRKFGLWSAGLLFAPLLFLALAGFVFHQTVGDQEYVKTTLIKADIYGSIEAFATRQINQNEEYANQPVVQNALSAAVSEENLRPVVEDGLNQVFLVLNKEVAPSELNVDLTPITDTFVATLETTATQALGELPTCTTIEASLAFEENPLEASCIPPGVEPSAAVEQSMQEFLKENDVLSSGSIDLDSLGDNDTQQGTQEVQPANTSDPQPQELLGHAANGYQQSKLLFPIASILLILAVVGLVVLSRPKLKGVQRAGWLTLVNGLIVTIISFVLHGLASGFAVERAETNGSLSAVFEDTGRFIVLDMASMGRIIGIVLFVLGLAAAVTATILLKKRTPKDPEPTDQKPTGNEATPQPQEEQSGTKQQ
jgi:hypothetical protein